MKKRYWIPAVICFAVAVAGVIVILFMTGVLGSKEPEQPPLVSVPAEENTEAAPSESDYVSAIDFQALWDRNPDIYAWLEIPGTNISYAVVQSDIDDEYYLRRDLDGNYAEGGTIFSQTSYNNREMTDLVTILYGHHMTDGTMFGELQKIYSDATTFRSHDQIIVYLPDRELDYTVCAAVPYDSRHIMMSYDFNDELSFNQFWDGITSIRDLSAQFNDDVEVKYGDHLLILSTCLTGDNTHRYLVIGKLDTDDS